MRTCFASKSHAFSTSSVPLRADICVGNRKRVSVNTMRFPSVTRYRPVPTKDVGSMRHRFKVIRIEAFSGAASSGKHMINCVANWNWTNPLLVSDSMGQLSYMTIVDNSVLMVRMSGVRVDVPRPYPATIIVYVMLSEKLVFKAQRRSGRHLARLNRPAPSLVVLAAHPPSLDVGVRTSIRDASSISHVTTPQVVATAPTCWRRCGVFNLEFTRRQSDMPKRKPQP